jgi:hypothetical protein
MKKPPLAVIVLAVLLIAGGLIGLVGGLMNHTSLTADHYELLWIGVVNLLAMMAGIFILRGRGWARWLAVAWLAFHVAISIGHPLGQLIMHAILLLLFAYGLFRAEARPYFQST